MSNIPVDVLLEILPLVRLRDLGSLARANKYLSEHALDRMYEHIDFKHIKKACHSIVANPDLARRVKTLQLDTNSPTHGLFLLPFVSGALCVTQNLRTLRLDVDGHYSQILRDARSVFKLRSFSCSCYTDDDFVGFLREQTELEELRLTHSYVESSQTASGAWHFPHLQKFEGPMSWVETIVPKHPVSHLTVTTVTSVMPDISALGLTAVPIKYLRIPFHAVGSRTSEELQVLLPALESLFITASRSRTTMSRNVPHTVQDWLRDLLQKIPTIERVGILGWVDFEGGVDLESFVTKATELAPAVREFTVQRTSLFGKEDRVRVLEKGSDGWIF
ncbi:hypothetical protein FB45DRAFT_888943 [Roridomyces roridus]|uniref:F-box domain-containing protein n=1 Tax=Roridomyces roridus TaxID=1738132 RepID=A0AAD7CMN7_9AGAR|nr:hypothetical protein FB45DRAFT_888943 [Roridomyces roridus]